MADLDTALMLRLEANLAKFERTMSRARQVGESSAVGIENQFRESNRKLAQTAEQSANAIGAEMDRLRTKYDPLFAASKRYETSLDELNRAQRVGALTTQQHEAALENLNAEYMRATAGASGFTGAGRSLMTTTRGMGGGIQNVAYQIGDFAVQVGAGTSATQALGQQLPQLLGGFGVLGAVMGAVAAIALPLGAYFLSLGGEAEDLEKKADNLTKAVDEYRDAVRQASLPTAELAEKYGTATEAARTFISALREITQVTALEALEEQMKGISESFGSLSTDVLGDALAASGTAYEETLRKIRSELGVTGADSLKVVNALKALDAAEGPKEAVDAIKNMLSVLEDVLGAYDEMDAAGRKVYDLLAEASLTAAELAGGMDGASNSISAAASQAGRLADELGRAVSNAISLAAQGISDVRRAKIEYDYRDDPVGRATALAEERFNTQTATSGPLPDGAAAQVQRDKDVFVAAATEAAEYTQKLADWRNEQAKAASEAKKSGSKGRKGKKIDPLFENSDEELLQIERRIEMIGMSRAEMAKLTAQYDLLDEAKKRDLDLDARQAGTGETLRQQIERQAAAIGDLTEKYEQAQDRAKFFDDIQTELKDGLVEAIVEGENFAGVLENVAKMLAKAALQAALFGDGPLAGGGGGGGLLGGLLSGIFGGQRAAGGPVQAGRVYMDGAHGREPFIPAVNGRILSTAQAQSALAGGNSGGVSGSATVHIVAPEGFSAQQMGQIQGIAVKVTSEGVSQYDKQLPNRINQYQNDPRVRR